MFDTEANRRRYLGEALRANFSLARLMGLTPAQISAAVTVELAYLHGNEVRDENRLDPEPDGA